MISQQSLDAYRKWMLGQGFSYSTIRHALTFIPYLERMGLDLEHLTEGKALDFLINARESGVKLGTLNGWVRQINRWARFKGLPIHLERYRAASVRDIEYIPDEAVKRILSLEWPRYDLSMRNRAVLWVAFGTGVRVSELVSLNWSDVDWNRNLIYIRHGKGNKSRKVPVPQAALDVLREYKPVRHKTDPHALFTTHTGRMTDATVRKIFKDAGQQVGVPWIHPHAARHWRAKKLLQEGVSLNVVQKVLGHSNIKTTSLYLEVTYNEVVADVENKDVFFTKEVRKK